MDRSVEQAACEDTPNESTSGESLGSTDDGRYYWQDGRPVSYDELTSTVALLQPAVFGIGDENADNTPAPAPCRSSAVEIANSNPIDRRSPLDGRLAAAQTAQENPDEVMHPFDETPAVASIDDGSSDDCDEFGERRQLYGASPFNNELTLWIAAQANLTTQVTWRRILGADLKRPQKLGGYICPNICDLVQVYQLGGNTVRAMLRIDNSYARGDGIVSAATAVANDKADAIEQVCKKLMIRRLLYDARVNYPNSTLRLVPNNWRIGIDDMLQHICHSLGRLGGEVFVAERLCASELHTDGTQRSLGREITAWAAYVQPAAHEVEKRNIEIANLLVSISRNEVGYGNEAGWAHPNFLKRMRLQRKEVRRPCPALKQYRGTQTPLFLELGRLVEPRTLLKFLQDRPQIFEVKLKTTNNRKLDCFRSMIDDDSNPVTLAVLERFLGASEQPATHVRGGESVLVADVLCVPGSSQDHRTLVNQFAPLPTLVNRRFKSSRTQPLQPVAQGNLPPPAEREQSTVGVQYSPRYHVPEPHDVEPRNIHIEGLLKSLSEKADGWVSPDSLNQDVRAELTRLVKPGTLFHFLLDRPWDFEVTAQGYDWNAFRVIAHTPTVQPVEHLQLVGNCTCGQCWPHWFEEGWTCRGPAKQAG